MRGVIVLALELPDDETDTALEDELAAFVRDVLRPSRLRGFRGCHVAAGPHAEAIVELADTLAGTRPELLGLRRVTPRRGSHTRTRPDQEQ